MKFVLMYFIMEVISVDLTIASTVQMFIDIIESYKISQL